MFKEDEMKTDAEKKLKPRRPRKVIKKSHMEDSYPTYLQVCILFDTCTYYIFTKKVIFVVSQQLS